LSLSCLNFTGDRQWDVIKLLSFCCYLPIFSVSM